MMSLLYYRRRPELTKVLFVRELEDKYGAKKVDKARWVWSPVEGDWPARSDVKAAHLLPLFFWLRYHDIYL